MMIAAGSRVPVVLVHGIRTSASMWRHQLEWLAAEGHPVLAVDLPGHGSRLDEPFTLEGALAAIDAGVDQLEGPVLLVGLSLGGYYAIAYAAGKPERVLGLVAAGSSFEPGGPGLAAYRRLARLIHRFPDRGLWLHTFLVRRMLPPAGVRDVLAGGVALDVMDSGLTATGRLSPLADLRAFPGRVWLVNGAYDHFRFHQRRFLAAARHGTLVTIPGAGHLVSLHRPHRFDTVLRRILSEVEADFGTNSPDSVSHPGR
ncbi:alpha/beta fold hydrolase [Cryobacterium adonitolivorans]|uniref:Alpha/beta fold hydrolase n=1 Tax=Cryobacterium adonitolivorans TaxID=1259189 RepID=A0A4R8WDQ5_9MICO|nr:alpha/beta fold hydrolase [Cryobacterium adonitolivorans]TFC05784.1 alpha/beta fold hydrolase [Cryobacterium adonitolivorans]